MLDAVLSMQPRVGAGAAGLSGDAVVESLAAELLAALPPPLDRDAAAPGLFDRLPSGSLNSLSVVLGQELDRCATQSRTTIGSCTNRQCMPTNVGSTVANEHAEQPS